MKLSPAYMQIPSGVESYDINLEQKKVVVRGNVTPEQCVEKVSKMGKEVTLLNSK